MAEHDFSPLGTAALRSSVALDASGAEWAKHLAQSSQQYSDRSGTSSGADELVSAQQPADASMLESETASKTTALSSPSRQKIR